MIAYLNLDVDAEGCFCAVVSIQTDNDFTLTHTQGFKLDVDPTKTLLKLVKGSPIKLDFVDIIATASSESVAKVQTDIAAKAATQAQAVDDAISPAAPSADEAAQAVDGEIVAAQ